MYGWTFQRRVYEWVQHTLGRRADGTYGGAQSLREREYRFLEEALELVQACGLPYPEAQKLLEYVYGRDAGQINQEIGGTMITLAALCQVLGIDMQNVGEAELNRCWTKAEAIRAKQLKKEIRSEVDNR